MSSDNGVYILKTKRNRLEERPGVWTKHQEHFVYRIAYASAVDNFDYIKDNQLYNLGAYMKEVWGKSKVYLDEGIATLAAEQLSESIDYTEYGVVEIDASDMIFYGDH